MPRISREFSCGKKRPNHAAFFASLLQTFRQNFALEIAGIMNFTIFQSPMFGEEQDGKSRAGRNRNRRNFFPGTERGTGTVRAAFGTETDKKNLSLKEGQDTLCPEKPFKLKTQTAGTIPSCISRHRTDFSAEVWRLSCKSWPLSLTYILRTVDHGDSIL